MRMRPRIVEAVALTCIALQFVIPRHGVAPDTTPISAAAQTWAGPQRASFPLQHTPRSYLSSARHGRIHPLLYPGNTPPGQCGWVRDCTFQTYVPGATTANWYPNSGGSANTYTDGSAVVLPYVSGTQEAINFGPYDPQSTYSFTLTFDAKVLPVGDADAQLYVGFSTGGGCSYNWFRLFASYGLLHLSVTGYSSPQGYGTSPSGASNQPGPPPVICFLNEYGNHGTIEVSNPVLTISQNGRLVYPPLNSNEILNGYNPSEGNTCACTRSYTSDPVNAATGDFYHTFTDLAVPGRGLPLAFTRTYNSLTAAQDGPVGFGWSENYNILLTTDASGAMTVTQENGTIATFSPTTAGGYEASGRVLASLVKNGGRHGGDRPQRPYLHHRLRHTG